MGICASEEERRSKALDEELKMAELAADELYKLLLLGPGESGKSTFFKQIVCSYGPGFNRDYRIMAIPAIHCQILKTIKSLIQVAEKRECKISEDTDRSKEFVQRIDESEVVTQEVAWHVGNVWNDSAIRTLYNSRFNVGQSFYVPDSTEYFFGQLHTISDPMYVPSNADLFRVRIPTTGILDTEFSIKGARFLLVDVGGQRNERRKWINCFDGVKAVLFVLAISEYDQELYEDSKINRMQESLDVFGKIVTEYFPDTSIIVFFNKMDKFKEKVRKVPVYKFFPDYLGKEGDHDGVIEFFKEKFSALNLNPNRRLFFHATCATETKGVKTLFVSVRDIVIREKLKRAALL